MLVISTIIWGENNLDQVILFLHMDCSQRVMCHVKIMDELNEEIIEPIKGNLKRKVVNFRKVGIVIVN